MMVAGVGGRAATAGRARAAVIDRSMKDGRGLDRHPLALKVAIGGDVAEPFHSPPNFRSTGPLPSI
jgi:hypothetical protein